MFEHDADQRVDCLKCIAWKGRALVVGFAGGEIEKVGFIARRIYEEWLIFLYGVSFRSILFC